MNHPLLITNNQLLSVINDQWNDCNHQLKQFIPVPANKPPGYDLKRCDLLNRIGSDLGRLQVS